MVMARVILRADSSNEKEKLIAAGSRKPGSGSYRSPSAARQLVRMLMTDPVPGLTVRIKNRWPSAVASKLKGNGSYANRMVESKSARAGSKVRGEVEDTAATMSFPSGATKYSSLPSLRLQTGPEPPPTETCIGDCPVRGKGST